MDLAAVKRAVVSDVELIAVNGVRDVVNVLEALELLREDMHLAQFDYVHVNRGGVVLLRIVNTPPFHGSGRSVVVEVNEYRRRLQAVREVCRRRGESGRPPPYDCPCVLGRRSRGDSCPRTVPRRSCLECSRVSSLPLARVNSRQHEVILPLVFTVQHREKLVRKVGIQLAVPYKSAHVHTCTVKQHSNLDIVAAVPCRLHVIQQTHDVVSRHRSVSQLPQCGAHVGSTAHQPL